MASRQLLYFRTFCRLCSPFNLVNQESLLQIACDPDRSLSLIDSEIKQLNLPASLQQFPHNPCDKEETTRTALGPQKNLLIRVVHERWSPPVTLLLTAGLAGPIWHHPCCCTV